MVEAVGTLATRCEIGDEAARPEEDLLSDAINEGPGLKLRDGFTCPQMCFLPQDIFRLQICLQ